MASGNPETVAVRSSHTQSNRRARTRNPWIWAGAVLLLVSGSAATGYGTYRRHLTELAQNDVRARLAPHSAALSLSVAKRLSLLAGLKSFVELDPGVVRGNGATFLEFTHRMLTQASGLRAVQFVSNGTIRFTYPLAGNEAALGYNLLEHPNPVVRDGVLRARRTGRVTLSGPAELLQGGLGLIARQSVLGPDSEPFGQVAVVLDLPAIMREAGLAPVVEGLEMSVRDGSNTVFFGRTLSEPLVHRRVFLTEGVWDVAALPVGGWQSVVQGALNRYVSVAGAIAVLLAVLTFVVMNRGKQLRTAVRVRTEELRTAYWNLESEMAEHSKSAKALAESEIRLRRVLEGSRDGFFDWDVTSGEMFVSDRWAEILGYEPGELEHHVSVWKRLTHPEDLPELERVLDDHFAARTPYFKLEHRLRVKSGHWKWVQVRGTVVERDSDGTPLRAAGIHTDIAGHKQLEEELIQAQKLEGIGRLAGGIAHDFNNLLTAIVGYAELAKSAVDRGPVSGQALKDDVEEIIKAGSRATDLTQELLAFARKQMINPRVVDLTEVIRNTIKLLKRLMGASIVLEADFDADIPNVRIDQSRFEQVLINLGINARDAMPDGGRFKLKVARVEVDRIAEEFHGDVSPGSYVRLDVSDTGTGMDEGTIALAFEPFFTTKGKGKGTGLGLSTSYGIIKQAGGYVLIESAVGNGTTFKIYLPAVEEQATRAAEVEDDDVDLSGNATILLVEDEPAVRRMISKALGIHGYTVQVAADGMEALELVESRRIKFDLLITDIVMPRLGGKELVERLLSLGIEPGVLYMSGYAEDAIMEGGVLATGLDFLAKPFTPRDLLVKVRSMLPATRARS